MPTSILITGVSGFIGAEIARAALSEYDRVVGLDIAPDGAFEASGFEYIQSSFLQAPFPNDALEGIDTVVHAASTSKPGPALKDYLSDIEQNVVGSLQLYEHAMTAGVKRFVFLSSGGTVYGPNHGPDAIAEDARCDPISYYGLSKLTTESYLQQAALKHPGSLGIARISNPFGHTQRAGMGQGLVATVLAQVRTGQPVSVWGDGTAVRDYVDVEDVGQGILALARYNGPHLLFNIGSGVGRTVTDVIHAIEDATGQRAQIHYESSRGIDVPFNQLDIERARLELGYKPNTDLSLSLSKLIAD